MTASAGRRGKKYDFLTDFCLEGVTKRRLKQLKTPDVIKDIFGEEVQSLQGITEKDEGNLLRELAAEHRRLFRRLGKQDHDTVVEAFGLMKQGVKREEEAWKKGDNETALFCLQIQKQLFESDLKRLALLFCHKINEEAEIDLYREIASFARNFILGESDFLKDAINALSRDLLPDSVQIHSSGE